MKKLKLNYEGVVIGSRTLAEYKFQIGNFMDMFWDNIVDPTAKTCMTVDVVSHNLQFEINRVGKETNTDVINEISLVEQIRHNINKRSHCEGLWNDLFRSLTKKFDLKHEIC